MKLFSTVVQAAVLIAITWFVVSATADMMNEPSDAMVATGFVILLGWLATFFYLIKKLCERFLHSLQD